MKVPVPGTGMPRVYIEQPLDGSAGSTLTLGEDSAHHLRVRRVREGDSIGITDGLGGIAVGTLESHGRNSATVAIAERTFLERAAPVHLLAPVGDRDRMLWLAEKAVELELTTWQPVRWRRSRSVSPRGEGEGFRSKLRARMIGAMLQSGGAWLPDILDELEPVDALGSAAGSRVILHQDGPPLGSTDVASDVSAAIGPEGGFEQAEIQLAESLGWQRASLGRSILRFETAGVVALGVLRSSHGQQR